jgi:hypothetical protein
MHEVKERALWATMELAPSAEVVNDTRDRADGPCR